MEIFLLVAGIVVLIFILIAVSYVKAPPDTAFIITGPRKQRVLIGQAGFRIPFFERIDKIPLNLIQVDIKTASAVPTNEFIDIFVDGVANIKISSEPDALAKASQIFLQESLEGIKNTCREVLEGNMREIIGQIKLTELVQNRDLFAQRVTENALPDMQKMGIDIINLTIQNFSDKNGVIQNLGVDNIAQIQKNANIARATAERDVAIAKAAAAEAANKADADSKTRIIEQNTALSLRESDLKVQSDSARAMADAAYELEKQKRLHDINIAQINADIAKREREVELGQKEVELREKRLEAEIKKKADAEKYAKEQAAAAALFERERAAEANKFELQQAAEAEKIRAEAEKFKALQEAEALKAKAEAERIMAEQKAAGILAVGAAEAEAIERKALAMKKMEEAAILELILNSNVLPNMIRAAAEPIGDAFTKIGSITMYGEGNNAKLAEEINTITSQVTQSIQQSLGLDLKSVIAGYFGGKIIDKKETKETE